MGSIPKAGTYSASRISTLAGLNKYQTPLEGYQVLMEEREPGWNEKHGYRLPVFEGNAATRWGTAFESAIIKLAEEREDWGIINKEKFSKMAYGDVDLTCHIDGRFLNNPRILHEGKTTNAIAYAMRENEKLRWGEPGTEHVPEEYQIQCAVQRICTGAELVKLSVLVFPKPVDTWEGEGYFLNEEQNNEYAIRKDGEDFYQDPYVWALSLSEMGYFHTYNLQSNPALETAIIEKVQDFHERYVIPGIPPDPQNWDDIRRLLPRPIGTIIANPELAELCTDYSEVTRQLGNAGPLQKRKKDLRQSIMATALKLKRDNWNEPDDKLIIISPDGGGVLATFSANEEGQQRFFAKRAR